MPMNARLHGVLDWLLEGYPAGVPPKDYIPLLALLRRRLTEEDVQQIADEIARREPQQSATDIGVSISRITDALPSPEDIARVEHHLSSHHGWPEAQAS